MKPDWNRRFAAGLLAILLCLCSFSMPAFASGSDPAPEHMPPSKLLKRDGWNRRTCLMPKHYAS